MTGLKYRFGTVEQKCKKCGEKFEVADNPYAQMARESMGFAGLCSKCEFRVKVKYRAVTQRSLQPFDTDAEEAFYHLVRKRFPKVRLVNQFPVKGFRLDFFFPDTWLAVEIDGPIHYGREIEDLERDAILKDCGIQTVRFANEEVFENDSFVVSTMSRLLKVMPETCSHQHQKAQP